jgi:hypothetical protein
MATPANIAGSRFVVLCQHDGSNFRVGAGGVRMARAEISLA